MKRLSRLLPVLGASVFFACLALAWSIETQATTCWKCSVTVKMDGSHEVKCVSGDLKKQCSVTTTYDAEGGTTTTCKPKGEDCQQGDDPQLF